MAHFEMIEVIEIFVDCLLAAPSEQSFLPVGGSQRVVVLAVQLEEMLVEVESSAAAHWGD